MSIVSSALTVKNIIMIISYLKFDYIIMNVKNVRMYEE